MDEATQAIAEYASGLPEDLQDRLVSAETGKKLQEIAQKHRVYLDKLESLFAEVMQVLMGLTHPRDFPKNLSRALRISIDQAAAITADINHDILDPIRKDIEETYERNYILEKPNPIHTVDTPEEHPEFAHITKDDLLSEIENPLPTNYRREPSPTPSLKKDTFSYSAALTPRATTSPTVPVAVPQSALPREPIQSKEPDKLTETTISTTQKVTVTSDSLAKKHTTDPYREPVE